MNISVIVPTYKPKKYIWKCLDSLVSQTFPKDKFEVILVLNGCTEPWKTEIEGYIANNMQGMNVNFIHTEFGGVSNARNIALDVAIGEYIAFLDDDDFLSSSYLEELYKKADEETISVCYPLSFIDGTESYEPYLITGDYVRNAHKGKCDFKNARKFFSGPVYKLISRNIIGNRRFDNRFNNGEDSLFMFLISDKFKYVDFTSKKAVYYRRLREGSAVMKKKGFYERFSNQLKIITEYFKIWILGMSSYSISFFITRILGAVRALFESSK